MSGTTVPQKILIVGAGEFGLSTALSFLGRDTYNQSQITILDASPTLPNPSGSSVDANRIIRADYASKFYAALAIEAQVHWRDQTPTGWGGEGRYVESGFVLTATDGAEGYVDEAMRNVQTLARQGLALDFDKIEELHGQQELQRATKYEGTSGEKGYANWNSGWAHAEKTVDYAIRRVIAEGTDRVHLRAASKVDKLLIEEGMCRGVVLQGGEHIHADLVIVAAGAWTPSLVDLEGRCLATGQTLAYIRISAEEQAKFYDTPVIMNMSNGMFVIPPRERELKIARHGYGYQNPVEIQHLDGSTKEVSIPRVGISIPQEAEDACRLALREWLPEMADRPFIRTRICWYCDTPDAHFLIDFHPEYKNLFLATGGSGHGFKFFPIMGDKIVDSVERRLDPELQKLWAWERKVVIGFDSCDDGSRSGPRGMILEQELARDR